MAVTPVKLKRITAELLDVLNGQIGGGGQQDLAAVRGLAHVAVAAAAFDAGANGAEAVEGVAAFVVVGPDNFDEAFVAVNLDTGRSWFLHFSFLQLREPHRHLVAARF